MPFDSIHWFISTVRYTAIFVDNTKCAALAICIKIIIKLKSCFCSHMHVDFHSYVSYQYVRFTYTHYACFFSTGMACIPICMHICVSYNAVAYMIAVWIGFTLV